MKPTFKSICQDIIYAQICSDSGKGIEALPFNRMHNGKKCHYYAYDDKNFYILRAIKQIDASKYLGVTYYVCREYEYGDNLIIYFNIKADKKKFQVSFHSPGFDDTNIPLRSYVGKTHIIRWDKKSSRSACEHLIKILGL